MLEDDGSLQKATLTLNDTIVGGHYVIFIKGESGYFLNPQSSIFKVEEDDKIFSFELSVE